MSASRSEITVNYKLSDFAKSLVPEERDRYCKTLKELKCHDPLAIDLNLYKSENELKNVIPPISKAHLILYLIVGRNGTNGEKVEAFKNLLTSPQYLTNTFADKLLAFVLPNGIVLFRTHVTHSQTLPVRPATPWVALNSDGKVIVGYCDCVAGLGGCCIHVSALLQQAISERAKEDKKSSDKRSNAEEDSLPVTSKPCQWNKPGKGPVTVGKVADLTILNARKNAIPVQDVLQITDDDFNKCNEMLASLPFLPVTLSTMERYASAFTPATVTHNVPKHLASLFNPDLEGVSVDLVDAECERVLSTITICKDERDAVELITRNQSSCEEWDHQRSGRITGTKICRVTKLNVSDKLTPGGVQFLLEMCYPEITKFTGNKYTRYGNKNEPIAAKLFTEMMKNRNVHQNFVCQLAGLFISVTHPYLAASPDRIISCDCHGKRVLEIKCPYSVHGLIIKEYSLANSDFFLKVTPSSGDLFLNPSHEYYYQIQLQLFVTECSEALLVVYNGLKDLEYVTVLRDEELIEKMVAKGKLFFLNFILPELISKRFSSVKVIEANDIHPAANNSGSHPNLNQFICSCQDPAKQDATVRCASDFCVISIFHKSCTKSKRFPPTWTCVSCKKEAAKLKRAELKKLRDQPQPVVIVPSQESTTSPDADHSSTIHEPLEKNYPETAAPDSSSFAGATSGSNGQPSSRESNPTAAAHVSSSLSIDLLEQLDKENVPTSVSASVSAPVGKKPRGRPRKNLIPTNPVLDGNQNVFQQNSLASTKRARKRAICEDVPDVTKTKNLSSPDNLKDVPKRARGRPRKVLSSLLLNK